MGSKWGAILVSEALVKINANLLEISQWNYKLSNAGVGTLIRDAFVAQMEEEGKSLRAAKAALESALSSGTDLLVHREKCDQMNESYKTASLQVRKHVAVPKSKALAKAKA